MVRATGLEPACLTTYEPKGDVTLGKFLFSMKSQSVTLAAENPNKPLERDGTTGLYRPEYKWCDPPYRQSRDYGSP